MPDREVSDNQLLMIRAIIGSDGSPTARRPDRRGRPPQLLRCGPRPAHGAVERVHPRRPPRARAGHDPRRSHLRRAHRRRRAGRRSGPARAGRARGAHVRRRLLGRRHRRSGPVRRDRHDRSLAHPAAARRDAREAPEGPGRRGRRHDHLARPPARRPPARPRRREPAGDAPRRRVDAGVRGGPPPRRPRQPPAGGAQAHVRSPSWPASPSCSNRRAPGSATTSTRTPTRAGVELRARRGGRRHAAPRLPRLPGLRRRRAPRERRPAGGGPHWKAIPLDGCTPRAVGVAVPRRGRLSAAARATQTVLQHVLATDGPSREGIRLIGG